MYPKKKRCIFFVVSRLIQWLQYVSLLGLLGFSFITGIFFFFSIEFQEIEIEEGELALKTVIPFDAPIIIRNHSLLFCQKSFMNVVW